MFDQLLQQVENLSSVQGVMRARVMTLAAPLRPFLIKLLSTLRRGQIFLSQLAKEFNLSEAETNQVAAILVEKGFLYELEDESTGQPIYNLRIALVKNGDESYPWL